MGMKLKSGADLCGFQLTNFCIQGEASAPSDAALGRKYFHTNATDDVATGISLLNRERIYLGEGAWRATAYLDDIAAINEKLNLITGDTDTDTLINNLKDLEEFLKDFSETDKLKSLLDGKLDKSGGTISGDLTVDGNFGLAGYINTRSHYLFVRNNDNAEWVVTDKNWNSEYDLIHSGNIGSQSVDKANKLVSGTTNTLTASGVVLNDANGHQLFSCAATWQAFGNPSSSIDTVLEGGHDIYLKTGSANRVIINSSGNVTIGGSDLAGTAWKAYINGTTRIANITITSGVFNVNRNVNTGALLDSSKMGFEIEPFASYVALKGYNTSGTGVGGINITSSGNILIDATDDDNSGAKLQVNGLISCYSSGNGARHVFVGNAHGTVSLYAATSGNRGLFDASNSKWMVYTDGTDIIMPRDVHITGNLIVDGEVSAGGAGAEEDTSGSGSGSAEGVSEIFTPTSTSKAFDHNLGEDVIVQVYEKSGNVWNMVIVDTEITSATRVTLRFGKTETTQHKVVIMGV